MKIQRFDTGDCPQFSVIADFTTRPACSLFEEGILPRPHLIMFSPPYPSREMKKTLNYSDEPMTVHQFNQLMVGILTNSIAVALPGAHIVINFDDHWKWHRDDRSIEVRRYSANFDQFLRERDWLMRCPIIWEKSTLRGNMKIRAGRNAKVPRIDREQICDYEHIWAYRCEHRPEDTIPDSDDEWITWDSEIANPRDEHGCLHKSAIWHVPPPASRSKDRLGHPCPWSLQLAEMMIKRWSYPGDVVLDPCVGGGTALEACRNLGRTGVGFDIQSKYAAMHALRLDSEPTLIDCSHVE